MAIVRFFLFILAISAIVGLIAKWLWLFIKKAKKVEEKAYDKLEEKVFPKENDINDIDIEKYEETKSQKKKK